MMPDARRLLIWLCELLSHGLHGAALALELQLAEGSSQHPPTIWNLLFLSVRSLNESSSSSDVRKRPPAPDLRLPGCRLQHLSPLRAVPLHITGQTGIPRPASLLVPAQTSCNSHRGMLSRNWLQQAFRLSLTTAGLRDSQRFVDGVSNLHHEAEAAPSLASHDCCISKIMALIQDP